MKRTIKLNENDLVRIVEGTARRMLTELDWKTYANAARRAKARHESSGINGEDEYIANARKLYKRYSGKGMDDFHEDEEREAYREKMWNEYMRASDFNDAARMEFYRKFGGEPDDALDNNSKTTYKKMRYGNGKRADHHVSTHIDPILNDYYVNLTNDDNPDNEWFEWDNGTERVPPGTRGRIGDKTFGSKSVDSGMENVYGGTPAYDKFLAARDEMDAYVGGKYGYRKGKGWTR